MILYGIFFGYFFLKGDKSPQSSDGLLFEEPKVRVSEEIPPSKPIPPGEPPLSPPPLLPRRELPKIAIVIDDLGYDRDTSLGFITLDAALTLSFLPNAPHSRELALLAKEKGREVLLHLPMEPYNYPQTDPGPGALLVSMDPETIRQTVEKNISDFPFVSGANNHMGSRFTENKDKMAPVFSILKKRNLFFMDSLTTPHSAGLDLAREWGVPYIQRNIFLDNEVNEETIKQQLEKLIGSARTKGRAVGSGHPYPLALKVLRESLPGIRKKADLVKLSELIQ
ncbi:MAG: divergent polysaccharide deacetylase family protein [Deltaproteobacteria bacterium]|nr:divergent polysaccharide deacetylase family protein [Deltaproteobacteria bacterium]